MNVPDEILNTLNRLACELVDCCAVFWESSPGKYVCDAIEGDWKHTHLNLDNLVESYLATKGIEVSAYHKYIDDTGSDWGTAVHSFCVEENVIPNILQKRCDDFQTRIEWCGEEQRDKIKSIIGGE